MDYGDIIYDQPNNENFCNKLETVQYNDALAITGSIKGTSKVKLYKELSLESLKCLCYFYKIKTFRLPSYLFNLILSGVHSYKNWNSEDVVTYHCRTDNFKYSFFPWTILEWNKLDLTLRKSSYKIFSNSLLKIIRPPPNPVYDIHNSLGLRFTFKIKTGAKSSEWAEIQPQF